MIKDEVIILVGIILSLIIYLHSLREDFSNTDVFCYEDFRI